MTGPTGREIPPGTPTGDEAWKARVCPSSFTSNHPGYWTDDDDAAWAPRLLARERAQDAAYAIRAWARGFPWLALCGSLGAALVAISQQDYLALTGFLTAIVLVFWPRANARVVYEVIRTEFIRRKLLELPKGEKLTQPVPVRTGKTYVRPEFHIEDD
jgi:hypothetical protein